ncbi:MAG: tetratricopeptide repeat protein [Alphaproteobacteria bacterium]
MKAVLAFAIAFIVAAGFAVVPANAAGLDSKPAAKQDPNYVDAKKLVDAGNFAGAVPLLEQVVTADPKNADAYNYLGYSQRKSGNGESALVSYQKALALVPDHRGANEYLGELYLEMGELDKAKERLEVLDDACFFGCDEHRELKEAINDYVAKTS